MAIRSRLFREPLVHFLVIGAVVFALYALVGDDKEETARDRIVVTEGRVAQLSQVFAKTWQRPPSQQELRGLVDAFIKEEVYYREAVKLGLDRDDTLIRRRMQQKMEFLSEPGEDQLAGDDAALQAYLDERKESYRVAPKLAFEQVFINPKTGEEDAKLRAAKTLKGLKAGEDPASAGDPTLLPPEKLLSPQASIVRDFGDAFAKELLTLPLGEWAGPITSPFGLHLVRVSKRVDGYDPPLEEVRAAVLRDWRALKREDYRKEAYDKLLAQYEVALPSAKKSAQDAKAVQ